MPELRTIRTMTENNSPKHVLLVDDDVALTMMLEEMLKDEGLVVTVAHNGRDGFAAATEKRPDLILLDMMMPGESGLSVLARLRKDDWGKTARVVLLTNVNEPEALENAKDVGAEAYLVKANNELSDITAQVQSLLRQDTSTG